MRYVELSPDALASIISPADNSAYLAEKPEIGLLCPSCPNATSSSLGFESTVEFSSILTEVNISPNPPPKI